MKLSSIALLNGVIISNCNLYLPISSLLSFLIAKEWEYSSSYLKLLKLILLPLSYSTNKLIVLIVTFASSLTINFL